MSQTSDEKSIQNFSLREKPLLRNVRIYLCGSSLLVSNFSHFRKEVFDIINSQNNFRVKQWLKLKDKFNRDKQKRFLVHGYHLVLEAYRTGMLEEVICSSKTTELDVPTFLVSSEVMERISMLAAPPRIMGVAKQKTSMIINGNAVFVNAVHHPGNLGTIIRNAAAFDVATVIVESSVDAYNPKVVQASQGMIFHVNIIKSSLQEQVVALKKLGYQIIGTDILSGNSMHQLTPAKKWGLVLGSEKDGVGEDLLKKCDVNIKIDMSSKCESLNVGVASGIILNWLYTS